MPVFSRWARIFASACLMAALLSRAFAAILPFQALRPTAMGGAYLTLSDDENALFYNPAGLANVDAGFSRATLLNPLFEISPATLDLYGDLKQLQAGGDPAVATAYLSANPSNLQHYAAQLFPSYYQKGFAAGILLEDDSDYAVQAGQVRASSFRQAVLALGLAGSTWREHLQLGARVQLAAQQIQNKVYSAGDITAANFEPANDYVAGTAAGLGLGSLLQARDWILKPDLALVWDGSMTPSGPGGLQGNLRAGAGLHPDFSWMQANLEVELDSIGGSASLEDSLHAGMELRFFGLPLALRAGVYQSNWTAGAAFAFENVELGVASYAQKINSGLNLDRRWVTQLALHWDRPASARPEPTASPTPEAPVSEPTASPTPGKHKSRQASATPTPVQTATTVVTLAATPSALPTALPTPKPTAVHGPAQNGIQAQAVSPTAAPASLSGKAAMTEGKRLMGLGRNQEAIAAFQAAGPMKSARAEGWRLNNIGLCYIRLGQFKDAVAVLEQAVQADPKNAVATQNLGAAYENNGQQDKAQEAYQKAMDLGKQQ